MRSGFLNVSPPSEVLVASLSSPSEKGIRNKRKFRTEHVQASSATALQMFDCGHEDGEDRTCWTVSSSCPPNSEEVNSCITDGTACFNIGAYSMPHVNVMHRRDVIDMPPLAASGVMASGLCHGCCEEVIEYSDLQEPDWDNNSESQLEDILINMLDALYKDAIAKIVSLGYSQKDAMNAVLKNGRWNGKNALTSVVESCLTWLESGEAKQGVLDFTNLKDMESHVLAEMICLLKKVRPFLSKGDVMWCLLVCDMNLLLACAMEDDVVSPTIKESQVNSSLSLKLKTTSRASVKNSANGAVPLPQQTPHLSQAVVQLTNGAACKLPMGSLGNISSDSRSAFSTPSFSSSPVGKVAVAVANRQTNGTKTSSTLKSGQPPPVRSCCDRSLVQELKAQALSSPNVHQLITAKAEVSEQQRLGLHTFKCANSNDNCNGVPCLPMDYLKANMDSADMCAVLTKEKHVLKILRNHCLAQTFQPTPESTVGKQEMHSIPYSGPVRLKRMDGCASEVEGKHADLQKGGTKNGLPELVVNTCQAGFVDKGINNETDLCLATTPETSSEISSSLQVENCLKASTSSESCDVGSTDRVLECSGADGEQRKTEMLLQLIDRIKHLESQLQEWSDWAQQKVMQAAQRLRKDSSELKTLRLERDEYARLKKEKQTLEESTMKKLSEMENALRKALSQVDRANTTAHRLKAENAEVRAEMEAAKLTAAEYVSACQSVAKKESKSVKKAQAWEKQKMKLQDELTEEKRKLTSVLWQLSQANERHQQAETRWRHEKKAKEEALALVDFEKRAKEQVEVAFKRQEEALHRKAEAESQCQHEEVQRLQSEISQLRVSLGLQPTLTWLCSQSDISQSCSADSYKQINARLLAEIASLQDSQSEIRRDRECVMCMSEEMSIVFLPCAHQVICIKCNELHLKRGLNDCPSCRTPIEQRIRVYGVDST